MSAANVEVVRETVQRLFLTGQLDLDEWRPDFELRDHELPDMAGEVFRGEEGFMAWLSRWAEAFPDSVVEPERYVDAGDRVVAILALTATGGTSGVRLERRDGMVFTFEKGVIARVDYYGDADQALEAAGA
jgi:ketosteroid isomerase-like protein